MESTGFTTSASKHAAATFLRLIVAGQIREAYTTYVDPAMRHHNIAFPGDAASLAQAMEENHARFPHKTLDIKLILEDGDLVTTYSHVRLTPGDPGLALIHIFRFANDRIIELWDLAQPVPSTSPNENGMF